MSIYSIKDLEILSGIKAHTLRIWEQRYQIIEPKRTDTNIRLYDDTDLRKILNISLLNQSGIKISKIASMREHEISEEVTKISDANLQYPDQVNALVLCMINYDQAAFDKVMAKNILQFGFEKTMMNIVFPFLQKVGLLWLTGSVNPSQEHFITNLLRQKLMVAIEGQIDNNSDHGKKFLIYLPEGEYHDIAILFASYIIKSKNNKVLYLGQSLPLEHIVDAYRNFQPDYVLTNLVISPTNFTVPEYIHDIASVFSNSTVLLSGYLFANHGIKLPPNIKILDTFSALTDLLD